jgi:hypothetical protein
MHRWRKAFKLRKYLSMLIRYAGKTAEKRLLPANRDTKSPPMLLACRVFVCECFFCTATKVKEATISIRLTTLEKGNLEADARLKGIPAGTAAAVYISEGVRRSQFPAVEFRNGSPGRVAFLAGSRWPVWMIVQLVQELNGDIERASVEIRKPAALVKMAMAYADAYPEEINDCLQLHAHRDFEGMKKILPGLELLPQQTTPANRHAQPHPPAHPSFGKTRQRRF